jgi:hypothetical protein
MTHEEQHAIFWAKVRRLQDAFHGLRDVTKSKPDSIRPKSGQGLTLTSYSSVFWVGRHLLDPDARQLKQLSDEEFEELLRAVENNEYEAVWARTGHSDIAYPPKDETEAVSKFSPVMTKPDLEKACAYFAKKNQLLPPGQQNQEYIWSQLKDHLTLYMIINLDFDIKWTEADKWTITWTQKQPIIS